MRWNSLSKLGLVDPDMYKAHWPLFGFFAIKSCLFSAIGKLKFFFIWILSWHLLESSVSQSVFLMLAVLVLSPWLEPIFLTFLLLLLPDASRLCCGLASHFSEGLTCSESTPEQMLQRARPQAAFLVSHGFTCLPSSGDEVLGPRKVLLIFDILVFGREKQM